MTKKKGIKKQNKDVQELENELQTELENQEIIEFKKQIEELELKNKRKKWRMKFLKR